MNLFDFSTFVFKEDYETDSNDCEDRDYEPFWLRTVSELVEHKCVE